MPTIWSMMLVNLVAYLPLKACQEWGVVIATSHYGMTVVAGSSLLTWHEVGGMAAGFAAPILSDVLGGRRAAVVSGCSALGALAFGSLAWLVQPPVAGEVTEAGSQEYLILVSLFTVAGFGVHGVKTLAGLHAAENSPRTLVGLVGGTLELLGQVGAAAAGWPIGALSGGEEGWQPALVVFAGCCVVGAALGALAQATAPREKPKVA